MSSVKSTHLDISALNRKLTDWEFEGGCVPDRESLTKDAIQVHYGKCRIKCF